MSAGYRCKLQSGRFKLRIDFAHPWVSNGKIIRVYYRRMIKNCGGTASISTGDTEGTYSQSGVTSYESLTLDLTPAEGDTYVESDWMDEAVPDEGEDISIIGPDDASFLIDQILFAVVSMHKQIDKVGWPAYTRSHDAGAVTLYKTETASTAEGNAVSFSGTAVANDDTTGYGETEPDWPYTPLPTDYGTVTDTFNDTVDDSHKSRYADADSSGQVFAWQTNVLAARKVDPLRIEFANGLVMTLSDEALTSVLTDYAADVEVENIDGDPQARFGGVGSAVVAEWNLPQDERSLEARASKYAVVVNSIPMDPGIPYLAVIAYVTSSDLPPCENHTLSLPVTWKIATLDLDSQEYTFDDGGDSVDYTGYLPPVAPSVEHLPSGPWTAASAVQSADVPAGNARVTISVPAAETIEYLMLPPQARLVD